MTEVAEKQACSLCGGRGWVEVDEYTSRRCKCSLARALKAHLGNEIAMAPAIPKSPLFTPGEVDLTSENLFIRAAWPHLISHFRLAFGFKGLGFRFRIVTDARMLGVWFRDESFKFRQTAVRESMEVFNNLHDLMLGANLVVLRLGFLGHKNVAMSGVVKEGLMMREAINKPTWVIESPNAPFDHTNHTYSLSLAEHLNTKYGYVDLTRDADGQSVTIADESFTKDLLGASIDDGSMDDAAIAQRFEAQQPDKFDPYDTDDDVSGPDGVDADGLMNQVSGNNTSRKKKWGRK